ncbi:MAG: TetR/AcrR family transcriptional regulator [Saprospiraceae bacterium]
MKKTKEKILDTAHQLFNEYGVADVSLRKIAATMNISHGNLIYHFKTKNDILEQLHERILIAALEENKRFKIEENPIIGLWQTAFSGFRILYDYRFFMIDLNYIMRENPALHERFKSLETVRAEMYQEAIDRAIQKGLMRQPEYSNEYIQLIERVRIFSDFWISSSAIYYSGNGDKTIEHHASLFQSMFFPYLTIEGKKALNNK